ncbi:MAG: glutathione binding-like protein [Gammaproteobacteria bacterium]|nr:glutathione binding-like protein [Gammaproteobacteria bacterium]
MDLFDQRAAGDADAGEYGLSGEMKKTQYVLQLLGAAYCADTLKCILVAAEQGMEMNTGTINIADGENQSADFIAVSEFGMLPALKENDFFSYGVKSITEYINARGLGFSLIPKNVTQAAEQDDCCSTARNQAGPHVSAIVQETLVKSTNDATIIDAAKVALAPLLDDLEQRLAKNKFIAGKNFSLADIYWMAHLHLLSLTPANDLIEQHTKIKAWMETLRAKKSNCGQALIATSLLPTIADIQSNTIKDIVITDF